MRTSKGLLLLAATGVLAGCTDHLTGALTFLPPPASVSSISLNGAIHLSWSDDGYLADPSSFDHYRVYSTSYSIDLGTCGATFSLEGTTVAPTFLVGALTNGVPRCFAITSVSFDGGESQFSPLHNDTPRPDAQSVVVWTQTGDPAHSGFRFWFDANLNGKVDAGELGLVAASSSSSDFNLQTNGPSLVITPVFTGTTVQAVAPVDQLTDIDFAPATGYSSTGIIANVRTGYIFQINNGGQFLQYGAIHVSAVGPNYIIFDWSYQTDPGNPELIRVGRTASMP
jgi:hypothetical protein